MIQLSMPYVILLPEYAVCSRVLVSPAIRISNLNFRGAFSRHVCGTPALAPSFDHLSQRRVLAR